MNRSRVDQLDTESGSTSKEAAQKPARSRWWRHKNTWVGVACVALVGVVAAGGVWYYRAHHPAQKAAKEQPVIRFMSGELKNEDTNNALYKMMLDFTKETGVKVEEVYAPQSLTAFNDIGKYIYDDITGSQPTIDVTIVDGSWTSWFSKQLLDLKPYMADDLKQHFPEMIKAATFDDKVMAAPYLQDVTLLFYRKDLLEKYGYSAPPATWDELEVMAKKIQAGERKTNPDFWGYAWEADESESLTTSALEMQAAYGGGQIIDNGKITVNNAGTARGIAKAKGWIGTISPESTLKATESEAMALWSEGNAAFMRNWTFAYGSSANDSVLIKDKFGVTALPAGSVRRANTLGGEYLGVAAHTKYPKEAALFVQYMTSRTIQKRKAIQGDAIPTFPDLYEDKDVLAAQPWFPNLTKALTDYSVNRPAVGDKYIDVAAAYFTDIHAVLTDKVTTTTALKNLEADLVKITGLPTGAP